MRLLKILIVFVSNIVLSFFLHLIVYGTDFTYAHISDALFVVGIIICLIAFALLVGAFKLFQGLGYTFKVMLSPSFRDRYADYSEYKEERDIKVNNPGYLEAFIASLLVIIISGILAGVA